ncbi:MAG: hypothetical protein K5770_19510 [Lachnospiraceae bacterium]|nr:hypothetical protein [Lachnospiraceae bacterium]
MFFPIFTTIGLILAFFSVYMRRSRKGIDSELKNFWDRELKANSVRKQPLTDIIYIEPDFSALPFDEAPSDDAVKDYQDRLLALKDKKIVNLSGVTNTDLKLKYGVANLDYLSSCDENYTELVKNLYLWANALYSSGKKEEAVKVLEYGVFDIHTDVRSHYRLLADIYASDFDFEAIEKETLEAEKLTSQNRDAIVKMLKSEDYFHA